MADDPLQKTCPHCGAFLEPKAKVCPNCGTSLNSVWPPPPDAFVPPAVPLPPKTLTGRVWADFLLGAITQYLAHFATARVLMHYSGPLSPDPLAQYFAPGFLVLAEFFWALVFGALGYFGLRRRFPVIARGSGYASLLLYAVLLGALVTCRPLTY